MSNMSRGRVSRLASSCPKDFDFEFFVFADEAQHADWWSWKRCQRFFYSLHDNTLWNCVICIIVFLGIVQGVLTTTVFITSVQDIIYNLIYFFHMVVVGFEYRHSEPLKKTFSKKWGLILDVFTYVHYITFFFTAGNLRYDIKLTCYYLRLHRPFRYLLALTDSNLKGSVVGTFLKYMYFFAVAKLTFAMIWMELYQTKYAGFVLLRSASESEGIFRSRNQTISSPKSEYRQMLETREGRFYVMLYITYKLFLPIGLEMKPKESLERCLYLLIMLTGCLLVTGAAVASLALVISLYMRPEEAFRARFRLIMQDLTETNVAIEQRQRVETFYRMYWHKQKAVSITQLLPIFPSTLPASIYTDIYFEAQQKSEILRDLSYMFLWEVAKKMETIHYIPGDAIIGRNSNKSSIIYISYGDVEMLTAEDDDTPILRMARGSIISPCGGAVSMACGKSLVSIRAATFCTAHVLKAADLWRVALKYGKHNGQAFIILSAFEEHIEKVKRHFRGRVKHPVRYKSSILQFKRNMIALKEARNESGELLLARSDFFLDIAGCYIMRNRADSSLTEESDDICLRPTFPCILQPQSSLLFAWNGLTSMIIIIVTIVHPHYLVYTATVSMDFRFFDYVITVIFLLDIYVYLSTGAKVEEGVPLSFAQTSSLQIQNIWFVVDLVATLPIFEFVGDGHFAGLNKLLRLPKVFRFLKSLEEVNMDHSNVMRFLSYTLMVFLASYLVAALNQGFQCFSEQKCLVKNFTHAPHWVPGVADSETVYERKTFGFFWALSVISFTSHMTSSFKNLTRNAIIFIIIVLEISAIVHVFVEAVYSATIMVTSAMRDEFEACIENVRNFLISNKMEPTLRRRFIQYLQLCWYTDKAYAITHGKRSIYYDLPTHVHQEIFARQRNKYIYCVPVLKYLNKEDLKLVSAHARLFYTSPNEILLNTGDINNEIYIIKRGYCEIHDPDTRQVVASLHEKDYFGVLECLLRFPAFYTVRAVTHVQIFSISRKYLQKLIDSPKISDAMEFAKKTPEYTKVQRRREPFLDYSFPAEPTNLQRFPLPRKFQPDTAFTQPFVALGFFSFFRYIFPRFAIRPDGKYILRYEWFRGLCAIATSMICPVFLNIEIQFPNLVYIALFLDIAAYFDMFQRLLVGYYNERGILVYHPASTAAHYLKGAFLVDLLASLPLENLESNYELTHRLVKADGEYSERDIKQMLCFNRLLQLYRLPSLMEILSDRIQRRDVILVIKAIPFFLVLINVITSLMIIISVDVYANIDTSTYPPWTIIIDRVPGGSWVELFKDTFRFNMTESPWNLQLATYFFVVYETTTTGYNYFLPSSNDQMIVLIIGMFIGTMMTTYFAVMVISIRANVNKVLADYQENMKDIVTFMQRENMDKDLKKDVLSYYEYNWVKVGGLDYRHVLKLCDQISLRTDAILQIYGNTFSKCPVLYHCDISLLRVMGRAVHSLHFQNDTVVIEKDDVISDMYFIDYGTLELREIKDTSSTVTKLPKGSVFGNLDPTATFRCMGQVTATSDVHLLKINSLMFHKIILDFPTVKVLMKKYRPQNENYIVGLESFGGSGMSMRMSRVSLQFSRRRKGGLLSGGGKVGMIYVILICMVCVFGDIYNAGFNDNHIVLIVTLTFLDGLFVLKILVNTVLQFFMEEGEARDNAATATVTYLKTEFKYDVLSTVPLELFSLIAPGDVQWRLYSLLRLNRLLRLVTVLKSLQRHNKKLSVNLVAFTVVRVTMWFALFIHTLTCVWYMIGDIEDARNPNSSWRQMASQLSRDGCPNKYLCSFYFVLATVTENSVEDVRPMTQFEVLFVIILQIISTLVYMIYVGEFSNIIQYQSYRSFGFYCKYLELQEFLKNNRVSENLVKLVKKYSLHLWRENRGLQVPEFLSKAPNCLRLKLMSAAYLHHFEGSKTFRHCEPAFLRQLVGCLILHTYCRDIFVAKEGEITDAMYLVHRGLVRELDEDMDDDQTHAKGPSFGPGDFFGITQGLVRNTPFTYSYQTTKDSQVLTLRLKTWEYLLKHFPRSRYSIFKGFPDHPHNVPPSQSELEVTSSVRQLGQAVFQPLSNPMQSGPMKDKHGLWPMRDRRRSTVYGILPYEEDESDTDLTEHRVFSTPSIQADDTSETTVADKIPTKEKEAEKPPPMQRRKTFFEKVTESAKKLVKRDSFQGDEFEEGISAKEMLKLEAGDKDALLLAEDLAATEELLHEIGSSEDKERFTLSLGREDRYDEDEATSSQKIDSSARQFRLDSKEDDKPLEDEEDKSEFIEKRTPRLSFLPGLVQTGTEVATEKKAESLQTPNAHGHAKVSSNDDKKETPTDFILPKFLRKDEDYQMTDQRRDDRQKGKSVEQKDKQIETVLDIEKGEQQKGVRNMMMTLNKDLDKDKQQDTIIEINEKEQNDRYKELYSDVKEGKKKDQQTGTVIEVAKGDEQQPYLEVSKKKQEDHQKETVLKISDLKHDFEDEKVSKLELQSYQKDASTEVDSTERKLKDREQDATSSSMPKYLKRDEYTMTEEQKDIRFIAHKILQRDEDTMTERKEEVQQKVTTEKLAPEKIEDRQKDTTIGKYEEGSTLEIEEKLKDDKETIIATEDKQKYEEQFYDSIVLKPPSEERIESDLQETQISDKGEGKDAAATESVVATAMSSVKSIDQVRLGEDKETYLSKVAPIDEESDRPGTSGLRAPKSIPGRERAHEERLPSEQ